MRDEYAECRELGSLFASAEWALRDAARGLKSRDWRPVAHVVEVLGEALEKIDRSDSILKLSTDTKRHVAEVAETARVAHDIIAWEKLREAAEADAARKHAEAVADHVEDGEGA